MDILHLIKTDHNSILAAFPERAKESFVKKSAKLSSLFSEIDVHFSLEKDYLFPEVSFLSPEAKTITDIGLANHGIIQQKMKSLKSAANRSNTKAETLISKLDELKDLVWKHFHMEEQMLMPKIRILIQTELREDLGHVFLDAKEDLSAGLRKKPAAAQQRAHA